MIRALKTLLWASVLGLLLGVGALGGLWWYLAPNLPSIEALRDVQLQVPLRVYSRDGAVLAEFGEKRRIPLEREQLPDILVDAVLAAEDDRFYAHPGVDWQGLLRAGWHLLRTGEKGQGGSTITMQVARNFFLGREKTYVRKLREILLAFKIERSLEKDEILELYLNKIYLGQRAYGVGAAAQVYYGQAIENLNLAQAAMIAGLPKAPSRFNPVADPERAISRRDYVLRRMREVGFITEAQYREAAAQPVSATYHGLAVELEAPYVAETVRAEMVERFGEAAYTDGYTVYTTIDSRLQRAADAALRAALQAYDERHGYRGPETQAPPAALGDAGALDTLLADIPVYGGLLPAVVTGVQERALEVRTRRGETVTIPWEGLSWARRHIDENRRGRAPEKAADVANPGDVIRIVRARGEPGEATPVADRPWRLTQLPAIEGALVALDPDDGAVLASSGGFDFYRSKFNRVTQAKRQPGSNFKPFLYSAALEAGYTPASLINDAPVVYEDAGIEGTWRPENYSGKFFGPTRLRVALMKSRNLVSIRLIQALGPRYVVDYARRFGFGDEALPGNLSLALGSGMTTPLEIARGYAVFANGGFRVEPYLIERIVVDGATTVYAAEPREACPDCAPETASPNPEAAPVAVSLGDAREAPGIEPAPRAITAENAWLMSSLLRDVVRHGTARRALTLGRGDLAGKTGTTNDQRDAWFSGFTPELVATAWVGFDKHQPLGARETGSRAALPMWIDFMGVALEGVPEKELPQPEGIVTVRIDPETGLLARAGLPDAIFESFRAANVPSQMTSQAAGRSAAGGGSVTEQLF